MSEKFTSVEIACFGELLWDLLPDRALPGGAPMNVAYHLNKLGKNATLISRVGHDQRGAELISILENHGLSTDYVQLDDVFPTGIVTATPGISGDMQYDIKTSVAWDFITVADAEMNLVQQAAYFVFGSLAARSQRSGISLLQLLEVANTKVLDINLRPPHFDKQLIAELISRADIVKMNEAELALIAGWFASFTNAEQQLAVLQDRFNISTLIVTQGANGAMLLKDGRLFHHPGFKVTVADTIGSGDSFLAGFISQILDDKTPEQALEFASAIGAFVASQNGGCPVYAVSDIPFIKNEITKTSVNNQHVPVL